MQIYPVLRFTDAKAAHEWLQTAFGLEPNALHEGEGGVVQHAQMRWGDSMLMFGSVREGGMGPAAGTGMLYLSCTDPDGLFARATGAGAEVVMELTEQDYGSREFAVRDPEGNVWTFGTYDPAA